MTNSAAMPIKVTKISSFSEPSSDEQSKRTGIYIELQNNSDRDVAWSKIELGRFENMVGVVDRKDVHYPGVGCNITNNMFYYSEPFEETLRKYGNIRTWRHVADLEFPGIPSSSKVVYKAYLKNSDDFDLGEHDGVKGKVGAVFVSNTVGQLVPRQQEAINDVGFAFKNIKDDEKGFKKLDVLTGWVAGPYKPFPEGVEKYFGILKGVCAGAAVTCLLAWWGDALEKAYTPSLFSTLFHGVYPIAAFLPGAKAAVKVAGDSLYQFKAIATANLSKTKQIDGQNVICYPKNPFRAYAAGFTAMWAALVSLTLPSGFAVNTATVVMAMGSPLLALPFGAYVARKVADCTPPKRPTVTISNPYKDENKPK